MSLRARQLLLLLHPTARASEWVAPVAGAVLAIAIDSLAGRISAALGLEFAAIALALGVSFAFDDPAGASIAASPTPLALRHSIRAAGVLPLPAAVWIGLLLRTHAGGQSILTLVLAGLVAWAFAIAAVGTRVGDSGGLIAAPSLLALAACAFLLPGHVSLFPAGAPSSEGKALVVRWVLVLGLAACTWVAASLDPASQHVLARRLRLPAPP